MSVVVALVVDQVWREPPSRVHPTVAVGRALEHATRWVPAGPPPVARRRGTLVWCAGAATAVAAGIVVERAATRRPRGLGGLVRGLALGSLVSRRLLLDEVTEVGVALHRDVAAGRQRGAGLVSRDLTTAEEVDVVDAALGSLAENANDALIATLFWYAVAGLPGAALHRFADTADSCWGYRDARWRHAGRTAARADDVLAAVPARLTGLALAPPGTGVRALARAAATTASPNGGWPMAATALALDRRITKPGVYTLHPDGSTATRADITRAVRYVARRTTTLALGLAALGAARRRVCRGRSRGGPCAR